MYSLIYGNLDRQAKALTLLGELLDEEFSLLLKHETEAVMGLEFSIHELLRQLAVEKETVIRRLGGGKVLVRLDGKVFEADLNAANDLPAGIECLILTVLSKYAYLLG